MVVVTSGEHADEIDHQANRTDNQELVCVHFRGVQETLNGLKDDEE